tara:strand:- start:3631 stop:3987 length:357 start_codon:yes stop_codon:yes gene_type:complete
MPYPASKKKITLEEVGSPEYWCEFHLMGGMKFEDVKRLFGDQRDEEIPEVEYIDQLFSTLVIDWNLPAEDGGSVLPIPSVDQESIGKLPNMVVTFLVEQMTADDTELTDSVENLDVPS